MSRLISASEAVLLLVVRATCFLQASTSIAAAEMAPRADTPNIVLILADDLGYGDVHCLNPERGRIRTPHLDQLADQGMVFTDAHSGSSVCTPTRYGLLTGRYAWRTRLQSGVLDGFSPPLIDRQRQTVANLLQGHGYYTACVGKWHLGMSLPVQRPGIRQDPEGTNTDLALPIADGPTTRGFDAFFGISASLDMPPFAFIDNERFTEKPTTLKRWVRSGIAAPGFEAADVLPTLTRRAIEFLEQRAAEPRPFFLYLALTSPHTPILPTKAWAERSGLSPYADFVMQTDDTVGQVVAALDRLRLTTKTLVLFTSDNGCSPAAKVDELQQAGHFPSGTFRGYKADIWEGGHRVPFLVRWPGRVQPRTRCAATICLTDFMATVADLVGAKLPDNAGEDSYSLLPVLLGTGKSSRQAIVHHSIHGKFAIRSGEWKLELCPGSGGWAAPRDPAAAKQGLPGKQLYNLSNDIEERWNVQAKHPEIVERLGRQLESLVQEGRSTPGTPQTNDVPVDLLKRANDAPSPTTGAEGLFAHTNLMAWCIVPFDGRKRGPEARAAMLERLGISMVAYDYRAEHVPTFDAELDALARHHIRLLAWWFPAIYNEEARLILDVLRRHNLRDIQLWVTGAGDSTHNGTEQAARVTAEAARLQPICEAAGRQGCSVGLYNHGGWYGEPENQVAIIERLNRVGITNVGIVYNLHHGHDHLSRFPALLKQIQPHLRALNLNGMSRNGDKDGHKILPLGQGELDLDLLRTIRDSGWRGPVGILNHTDEDAEGRLQDNLEGLRWLLTQLDGLPAGPRPTPKTWQP